jgi:flavin reductase (DIM6/NTAB) family NADH-FMN oxidoreductase RutF
VVVVATVAIEERDERDRMTDAVHSVGPDDFKKGMRCFTSGVTVVTTRDGDRNLGITVSAFSSLSLDPPLVLICVDKGAAAHDTFANAKAFVVNILSADQEEVSNRFASRADDKFETTKWHEGVLGLPVLDGSLGVVECVLHDSLPGGDHTIFVGRVAASSAAEGKPLLYGQGGYRRQAD